MTTIILNKGKEQSLLRFHPWVFSGAIKRFDGPQPADGELVTVRSAQGDFLGIGHYEIGSIAVRILSFTPTEINSDFFCSRLAAAYQLRKTLNLTPATNPQNNTYRLVHGEGDQLPGLVIDIYGDSAVLQAHSVGMHFARELIAQAIIKTVPEVQNVYYKSSNTLPFKATENLSDTLDGYLIGGNDTTREPISIENGLSFHIDWLRGQKTGFFIDQRENRALVQHYASNRNVLNMFCYTGGFSCYALRGGASLVHSVDSSAKAIELTNQNISLNFDTTTAKRHKAFATDAFDYLQQDSTNNLYDLIILDPPAFAKHRSAISKALQGYRRLNALAFSKIKPGGILFTFSCSQAVNKDPFRLAVFSAAAQSHRHVRILHFLSQPADHPINIYHPEGEYLKGLVLYVE